MGNPVLLQNSNTPGQCCTCDQQVDCGCGIGCNLKFQTKTSTATLCGYSEYTSPSSPPKKFLNKSKTGTMYIGTWDVTGCPVGACQGAISRTCTIPSDPHFTGSGTITITPFGPVYEDSGHYYRDVHIHVTCHAEYDAVPFGGSNYVYMTFQITGGAGTSAFDGQTVDLGEGWPSPAMAAQVWLETGYGSGGGRWKSWDIQNLTAGCDDMGVPTTSARNVWNYSSIYSPTSSGCGSPAVTDTSARYEEDYGLFPLTAGGTAAGSVGDPNSSLTNTTTTSTSITINGSQSCVKIGSSPDVWSKAQGQTTEQLTSEDTEDMAIARANAGITNWTSCTATQESSCSAYNSVRGAGVFTLSYRSSQYAIDESTLQSGKLYQAQVNLQRRAYPSSDPFVDYQQVFFQFTAQPGNPPTWHDIPSQSGWETAAAASCVLTLIE